MEQEDRYLDVLAGVTAFHIYGQQLWLESAGGQALVFSAMAAGEGFAESDR